MLSRSVAAIAATMLLTSCYAGYRGVNSDQKSSQDTIESFGKGLYQNNCAACHGPLEFSTKRGRNLEQINLAIASIPKMKGLQLLKPYEVNAIAEALTPKVKFRYTCNDSNSRGKSENLMRRMNKREIVNTLTDLLSANIMADSSIQSQLGLMNNDELKETVVDIPDIFASTHARGMFILALRAADLSMNDITARNLIYGSCAGTTTVTDTCAQDFIRNFGLRALRRPVTDAERADLLAFFKIVGGQEGLKRVMIRLLMNPALAFHMEFGSSQVGERLRLTDYEVASRLSYRITESMPDALLLAEAAKPGALQSLANLKVQAERLLNTPRGRARLEEFFRFYLQTKNIPDPYAPAGALHGIDTVGLGQEFKTEVDEYIRNVVWTKKGRYNDLMTSREVFPRSARMAKILRAPQAVGSTPSLTSADQAGLILRPALLADGAAGVNPFHRSLTIRRRMLCETFGVPDPDLVNEQVANVGDLSNVSSRERLTRITSPAQCLACHNRINPVGFVLDGYDQLGMPRQVETVFSASGQPTKSFPIDTRVDNLQFENASAADNAAQMMSAITDGMAARSCFAKTVFEYNRQRLQTEDDNCALSEVERTAEGSSVLDIWIASSVNEDIFWKAGGN